MKVDLEPSLAWTAEGLARDTSWRFSLDEQDRAHLRAMITKGADPDRPLFEYGRADFDLGPAQHVLDAAFEHAKHRSGIALLRGLPREGLTASEFRLLTWAIGLQMGVPRPQGKATQYLSEVRDAGNAYRTGTGRGYSSNAELDYHTDSADLVALSCFNRAASGGMSIVTSSHAAYRAFANEHPDALDWLHQPLAFSRQGEEASDEGPFVVQPVFDSAQGRLFGRWNWNRVRSAQAIDAAPRLEARHRQALEQFDRLLRRADLAHSMWLEPGDLQILNNHATVHSRTEFVDHTEPGQERLLYRLWIAPPDSVELPVSWHDLFRSTAPGAVRGGIRGHAWNEECRAFEARQAGALGLKLTAD
jgi:alpha-ketoglutarate-dependent taurine dioxygenase